MTVVIWMQQQASSSYCFTDEQISILVKRRARYTESPDDARYLSEMAYKVGYIIHVATLTASNQPAEYEPTVYRKHPKSGSIYLGEQRRYLSFERAIAESFLDLWIQAQKLAAFSKALVLWESKTETFIRCSNRLDQ